MTTSLFGAPFEVLPGQTFASEFDDPTRYCQCDACRNGRAIMPAPLVYDSEGYDQFGYDRNGVDRYGCTHLNRFGYDSEGYDHNGYDRDGYDSDGYDARGYDSDGYDSDGFDVHGRNSEGYDSDGYDRDGYDSEGYDSDGLDSEGCDRYGCYWATCDRCDERSPDLNETLDNSDVCDDCRSRYYTWCEDCDGYYNDDDADDHDHDRYDDDGCCESPAQTFKIRNDGCAPLANDTKITVSLPAGVISAEGINAIRNYLQTQEGLFGLSYDLEMIGDEWQTRNGNFAKRLSRHAYKHYQVKLSQDVMSQVGCIARDHSKSIDVEIDVTRDLNQDAGAFYHEDSCWWGSYYASRCALKTNGGFGLRSFEGWSVTGRAWVMPLRLDENEKLVPTFETMTPDAFVVFNGYGDLSGYAGARIISHMAGWTYRKIGFGCDPMYVNAGGYLIAPEHIAEQYTDRSIRLVVPQHANLYGNEKVLVNA